MDNILLIFLCLLVGLGMQRWPAFPKNGTLALNPFIIYVALPTLALFYIPKISISASFNKPYRKCMDQIWIVGIGIPISFITLAFWCFILQLF